MKIVYIVTTAVQLLFIVLVFVIVFHRPIHKENDKVLGLNIDVSGTLTICTADINKDAYVDLLDYHVIETSFFKNATSESQTADINKDKIIDIEDFSVLYKAFGKKCY